MPVHELMRDDNGKDKLAVLMTAQMVVSRATEAIHVSTAYTAHIDKEDDHIDDIEWQQMKHGVLKAERAPSQNPNRVECVVLMHATRGRDQFHTAPVTRHPDKPPELGEWDTQVFKRGTLGGRFGDALKLGLDFVDAMPQEMVDIIEKAHTVGEQADLVNRFIKVAMSMQAPHASGPLPEVFRIERMDE
jgi:hypothetical protein